MKKNILFFCFFLSFFSYSQDNEPTYTKSIESLIEEKPNNFFQLRDRISSKLLNNISFLEGLKYHSQKSNYIIGEMVASNYIGNYYTKKGLYNKAIQELSEGLLIAKEIDNKTAKLVFFNSIGLGYKMQYNISKSLLYFHQTLSEFKKIKNISKENSISKSVALNYIGNIYVLIKQYDLAIDRFNEAVNIKTNIEDSISKIISYHNIGKAFEKQNKLDKALEFFDKSLSFAKNDKKAILITKNSIARVLTKKGKTDKAYKLARSNFNDSKKLNLQNKNYFVTALNNLALVNIKKGNFKKAKKILDESINLCDKFNFREQEIEAWFYLSELYELTDQPKKSLFYYKTALEEEKNLIEAQNYLYINNLIRFNSIEREKEELKNYKEIAQESNYKISRSRNILIITLVSLALLSLALYSIYRQRLLNNDKRVLMLEQQALQNQMNPHFIFNALNSIKLYIINNDQKKAVYYLNKFSKLIRNILDVSRIKEVSLYEELKTMDLYMSIENIRFNNEIEYVQEINASLNLETIKVPPLILQPFLENAIWHGLSSKKDNRKIILSAYKISKNLIEITVTDNGIGRNKAGKIKENKTLKRKSIGVDLTKERLKTFSNEKTHEFSLKYYDLKDSNDNPEGTKVAIRLPLN